MVTFDGDDYDSGGGDDYNSDDDNKGFGFFFKKKIKVTQLMEKRHLAWNILEIVNSI